MTRVVKPMRLKFPYSLYSRRYELYTPPAIKSGDLLTHTTNEPSLIYNQGPPI